MPTSVICSGCGNKLVVRDELLGKRVKCPQCDERFVAKATPVRDEPAGPSIGEKLLAQWPGFVGAICIALALGYVWYCKKYPPHILYFRPVVVLIACGIASLGYWAFANESKSNF